MADSNRYRLVAGKWVTTSGCGCGGTKNNVEATGINSSDLFLVYCAIVPSRMVAGVDGLEFTYVFYPQQIILDLSPGDYLKFLSDYRFAKPTGAELLQLTGMKARQ